MAVAFFSPITDSFYEKVHELYSFDEKVPCVLNISLSLVGYLREFMILLNVPLNIVR